MLRYINFSGEPIWFSPYDISVVRTVSSGECQIVLTSGLVYTVKQSADRVVSDIKEATIE